MNEEIYKDLFKNVVINGHYPFEKINEMKSYIKTLNIKIENLEQQCKKQKEVIDKAIELIEKEYYSKNTTDINSIGITTNKLLQVRKFLKEVSE